MPSSSSSDSARDADAPDDPPPAVHIRFSPSQGPRLRRSEPTTCGDGAPLWSERPILMQRADGTYELIGTAAHLDGLARWVLSHGADAEVRGPASLRRRVVAEARRIVRRYDPEERDERPR